LLSSRLFTPLQKLNPQSLANVINALAKMDWVPPEGFLSLYMRNAAALRLARFEVQNVTMMMDGLAELGLRWGPTGGRRRRVVMMMMRRRMRRRTVMMMMMMTRRRRRRRRRRMMMMTTTTVTTMMMMVQAAGLVPGGGGGGVRARPPGLQAQGPDHARVSHGQCRHR
jgi:hypothetical protein